jgi:ubiquinone/menaquinone biosynthesis C-methylase UbiE
MSDFTVFADREREGWQDSGIVEAYIDLFGPVTRSVGEAIAERVDTQGKRILDLCCGQGDLTALLAERGGEVVGLDFSPLMLEKAEEAVPDVTFQQGDAADLPFAEKSFDSVVCNFGMMHLPDQPKVLTEIKRVLRPGGRFIMATWAAPDASPAFGTVFGAIKAFADMSVVPPQPDLFQFARREDAERLIEEAGMTLHSHETVTPTWEMDAPTGLFQIFLDATVGARMLIRSQSQDTIEKMRSKVDQTVEEKFKATQGYSVPVPVAVVTAARE